MNRPYLTPWCPSCSGPPDLLIGPVQAMCRNDDCQVVLWNMYVGPEQIDDAQRVDLPDLRLADPGSPATTPPARAARARPAEREPIDFALCRPVSLAGLPPELVEAIGPPMVDDTIMRCDFCPADIWVGPKKRLLHTFQGMPLICMGCAMKQSEAGATVQAMVGRTVEPMRARDVDPYRAEHPRVIREVSTDDGKTWRRLHGDD